MQHAVTDVCDHAACMYSWRLIEAVTGVSTAAEPENKQVQSGLDFIDYVFNGGVLNGMNVARFFAHGDNGERLAWL